jgi:hypothetical protein
LHPERIVSVLAMIASRACETGRHRTSSASRLFTGRHLKREGAYFE